MFKWGKREFDYGSPYETKEYGIGPFKWKKVEVFKINDKTITVEHLNKSWFKGREDYEVQKAEVKDYNDRIISCTNEEELNYAVNLPPEGVQRFWLDKNMVVHIDYSKDIPNFDEKVVKNELYRTNDDVVRAFKNYQYKIPGEHLIIDPNGQPAYAKFDKEEQLDFYKKRGLIYPTKESYEQNYIATSRTESPNMKEKYFFIGADGQFYKSTFKNEKKDWDRIKNGNVFKTVKEMVDFKIEALKNLPDKNIQNPVIQHDLKLLKEAELEANRGMSCCIAPRPVEISLDKQNRRVCCDIITREKTIIEQPSTKEIFENEFLENKNDKTALLFESEELALNKKAIERDGKIYIGDKESITKKIMLEKLRVHDPEIEKELNLEVMDRGKFEERYLFSRMPEGPFQESVEELLEKKMNEYSLHHNELKKENFIIKNDVLEMKFNDHQQHGEIGKASRMLEKWEEVKNSIKEKLDFVNENRAREIESYKR